MFKDVRHELRNDVKNIIQQTLNQSNRGGNTFSNNRGGNTFSNNRGNARNRFMGTRTNTGEPVCLRCRRVGHTGRVCTWRDPRIPAHYMQGNYYQPRPAMGNSNTPRGVIPENSAVRGRGAGSIPRGGAGRFGGPGYSNLGSLGPMTPTGELFDLRGIMHIFTRNKIIHFPHTILTMNLKG